MIDMPEEHGQEAILVDELNKTRTTGRIACVFFES